jgi:DNA-3-methyladenine glycosylase I
MPETTSDAILDPAPVFRCFGTGDPLNERYHDEEWGVPVRDDRGLYERLSLEAFQSGLSWLTILRKRPAFRAAFADFDAGIVADWGPADIERLMGDAGIVRNRAKIEATLANARALRHLHGEGGSLTELVWSHAPDRSPDEVLETGDIPSRTPESVALAKALKKAGFRFVGPTTAYAAMQACGVVNDHLTACPARARVAALIPR